MGKTKPGDDMQKLKSRVAAKARRKNENDQFEELVQLNPWIRSNPPDKSTVIRLTTSFIGLMKILDSSSNVKQIGNGGATEGIEKLSLEALDGFVLFLSQEGTITFVNEKALTYVGLTQNEMLGKSIYNFVLKKDWEIVATKLNGPLPSLDNPNLKQPEVDEDDEICKLDSSELFIPYFESGPSDGSNKVQFSVRVQCNLMRRNNSKSSNYRVLRFTGTIGSTGHFSGLVQPVWSPDVGDLPVYQSAFMTRLSPDLKLLFCEGRIHRYMDTEAKDLVGRVVYPFYHPEDIFYFQKLHSKLLAKGQCVTEPYRWMNKDGGWVWLESKVQQLKCEKTGRLYMLCVNYVLSAVENKGVVIGLNPSTNEIILESDKKESEHDSKDAYLYDPQMDSLMKGMKVCRIAEITENSTPQLPCPPEPKYDEPMKYDSSFKNDAPIKYDSPIKYESPVKHESSIKYDAPVKYESSIKYDAPVKYESSIKYDAPVKYDSPITYDTPVNYDTSGKYEVDVPATALLSSTEPFQISELIDLDDLQEFLANGLPDSDLQIGVKNSLNEGTAYTAAEFFLGNKVENLLTTPTLSFNRTVGFPGAKFYSQGTFCSPIIDSQSLEVNKPFNDSSSGSMEHINVGSEMLTAPSGNFVSEPDNMDIFSEGLPNMAEDQSLYTLEFNTQFLH